MNVNVYNNVSFLRCGIPVSGYGIFVSGCFRVHDCLHQFAKVAGIPKELCKKPLPNHIDGLSGKTFFWDRYLEEKPSHLFLMMRRFFLYGVKCSVMPFRMNLFYSIAAAMVS